MCSCGTQRHESKQSKVDGNEKGDGVLPSPSIYLKIDF